MRLAVFVPFLFAACGTTAAPRPSATNAPTPAPAPAPVPAPTPAPAAPVAAQQATGPMQLDAAIHGSTLDLTLTNVSASPLTFVARVQATRANYDDLAVTIGGRTLRFVDDRDKAYDQPVTLAPGAHDVEHVDLVEWAIAPENQGTALAAGTSTVTATWTTSAFTATASTTLALAAPAGECDSPTYAAPAGADLELLAHQVTGGRASIEVGVHNRGAVPVCVWTDVWTHEAQSDWLTISYDDAKHATHVIVLDEPRKKSEPHSALLPPGATAWQTWDLDDWSSRPSNHGGTVPSGRLWVTARYDSTKSSNAWTGQVHADFPMVVP